MACRGDITVVLMMAALVAVRADFVRRHVTPKATLVPSYLGQIRPTRELCEELNPPGYKYPQKTRSPFNIVAEWDETPDINIYVDSPFSLSFEGLIVQIRSDVSKEPIGSMNGYGSQAPTQMVTCVQFEDTAYLASRRWRQTESVYWYAPPGFNRSEHHVTLHATMILGPYIFWYHEIPIPLCTPNLYVYNENEPTVPPIKRNKFQFKE